MIEITLYLTFFIMALGYVATIFHALKKKQLLQTVFLILIPFYVFYYILKLPENKFKKTTAIACIGGFWVFFFVEILKFVFTPPT